MKMKKALLLVGFGTTFDSQIEVIDKIATKVADIYTDATIKKAFTSEMIISSLKSRDLYIDNTKTALSSLIENGYDDITIQSLHIIPGFEYEKMLTATKEYQGSFNSIKIGTPLLYSHDDVVAFAQILPSIIDVKEDEIAILMGHGTEHDANSVYTDIANELEKIGVKNILISTVEGSPDIYDTIKVLKEKPFKKVLLSPLMLVAGDHAHNDMASDESGSWKSLLIEQGYDVRVMLKGLGEYDDVIKMFLAHIENSKSEF